MFVKGSKSQTVDVDSQSSFMIVNLLKCCPSAELCKRLGCIAGNVLGIAEGGEKEAQMLTLAPQLAKPFFCLLIYIFQSK